MTRFNALAWLLALPAVPPATAGDGEDGAAGNRVDIYSSPSILIAETPHGPETG